MPGSGPERPLESSPARRRPMHTAWSLPFGGFDRVELSQLIDVLVVRAEVLDQVFRGERVRVPRRRPWLGQHLRVFDGVLVLEVISGRPSKAFDDVRLVAAEPA